jgi:hypothetical protein
MRRENSKENVRKRKDAGKIEFNRGKGIQSGEKLRSKSCMRSNIDLISRKKCHFRTKI